MILGLDATTVLLGITVATLVYYWMTFSRKIPEGPPHMPSMPLLGSLPWIGFDFMDKDPAGRVVDLSKKYGPVFSCDFGDMRMVLVTGYDAVKEVLATRGHDFADRLTGPIQDYCNPHHLGIIDGAYTPEWKEQRAFSIKNLKKFGFGKRSFEDNILQEVNYLLESVGKKNGNAFDMQPYLANSVSNVICMLAFGERWDHDDEKFRFLLTTIRDFFIRSLDFPFGLFVPWLQWLPGVKKCKKTIGALEHKITDFCKEQIKRHKNTLDPDNLRDFVDGYLVEMQAKQDDPSYSEEQLVYTLFDLFIAGTETSSTTLTWSVLFMANYPEVQAKVYEELDRVIGPGRLPSLHDQGKLPYTEAVFQEFQRMGNVVPFGPGHVSVVDTQIMGYKVPARTPVSINFQSMSMDPKVFPEPNVFKPERFLNENGEFVRNDKLVIFGLGPRMCLGQQLAKQEMFLFFTSLVHRFKIECPPGVDKIPEIGQPSITRTAQPFKVCLKAR